MAPRQLALADLAREFPEAYAAWLAMIPYLNAGTGDPAEYPKFEVERGALHARLDDIDQVEELFVWAEVPGLRVPIRGWADVRGGTTAIPALLMDPWMIDELAWRGEAVDAWADINARYGQVICKAWVGNMSGNLYIRESDGGVWVYNDADWELCTHDIPDDDDGPDGPAFVPVRV